MTSEGPTILISVVPSNCFSVGSAIIFLFVFEVTCFLLVEKNGFHYKSQYKYIARIYPAKLQQDEHVSTILMVE